MKRFFAAAVLVWVVPACVYGVLLAEQTPGGNVLDEWAQGVLAASASGYNDGSVMNPGRHWITADDFILPVSSKGKWKINSLSFVCGTDLNAQVLCYRVSIFADTGSNPEEALWQYQEDSDSLNNFTINSLHAGGDKDRYVHQVTLNTDKLNITLDGNMTYYISVEGDCCNPDDSYEGWDTYYQRFYMLGSETGEHWYSGQYQNGWSDWQSSTGDMYFAVEGCEIPEPVTVMLLGLGAGVMFIRKGR